MRDDSIRSIQTRLFLLLLRAFITVVLLILLIIFALTTYFLSAPTRFNPPDRIPLVPRLETFYLARGSWDNVKVIIPVGESHEWENATLLGPDGRILLYDGDPNNPLVGSQYVPQPDNRIVPLLIN